MPSLQVAELRRHALDERRADDARRGALDALDAERDAAREALTEGVRWLWEEVGGGQSGRGASRVARCHRIA